MAYIVIEGVDNCGKSTIAKELSWRLSNSVIVQEPSKKDKLRNIILNDDMDNYTRELLLVASRNESLTKEVKLYRDNHYIVISDRNYLSQLVYCDSTSFDTVLELNEKFMVEYKPDLTFIIDVPSDILLKRAKESNELNNLDSLDINVIEHRVKQYSDMSSLLISKYNHDIIHIDGTMELDIILQVIITYIKNIREY